MEGIGQGKNPANLNPIKIAKGINQAVGQVAKVVRGKRTLLITCKDTRQAVKLCELTELAEMPVKVLMYDPDRNKSKGVIKVNTDATEEDLLEYLKHENVVAVKRFKKKTVR